MVPVRFATARLESNSRSPQDTFSRSSREPNCLKMPTEGMPQTDAAARFRASREGAPVPNLLNSWPTGRSVVHTTALCFFLRLIQDSVSKNIIKLCEQSEFGAMHKSAQILSSEKTVHNDFFTCKTGLRYSKERALQSHILIFSHPLEIDV